jgi:hypothetical protein
MSLIWAVLSIVCCAASMVLCVLYMMKSVAFAIFNKRWSWRHTEDMILGGSAFLMFTFIIWAILDVR